jgi:hypothetical protein
VKPTEALSQIRIVLPELVTWQQWRARKNLDTGTLDRTIALLGEIKASIEAEVENHKEDR